MTAPNIEELIARLLSHGNIGEHVIDEAVDTLQSQAERIAELETEAEQLRKGHFDASEANAALRAQLVAIAAAEPVGYASAGGLAHIAEGYTYLYPIKTGGSSVPLFTHPMPTESNAELIRVIQFAITQGISAREFLDSWLHGDTAEWPEFANAKGAEG